jgi:hypothetical protein
MSLSDELSTHLNPLYIGTSHIVFNKDNPIHPDYVTNLIFKQVNELAFQQLSLQDSSIKVVDFSIVTMIDNSSNDETEGVAAFSINDTLKQGYALFEREQRVIQLLELEYSIQVTYEGGILPGGANEYTSQTHKDDPLIYRISSLYTKDRIKTVEQLQSIYATIDMKGNIRQQLIEGGINPNVKEKIRVMKTDYDIIVSPSSISTSMKNGKSVVLPDKTTKRYHYRHSFVKSYSSLDVKRHIKKMIPLLSPATEIGFDSLVPTLETSFKDTSMLSYYTTETIIPNNATTLESGGLYLLFLINAGKAMKVNINTRLIFKK